MSAPYSRNNNIMRAGAKNPMEISLSGAIPAHLCSRITIEKPEADIRVYYACITVTVTENAAKSDSLFVATTIDNAEDVAYSNL